MKRLLLSMLVGSSVGSLLAIGFLFLMPRLPQIFESAFFKKDSYAPTTIIKDISNIFKVDENQYFISSVDETISTTTKVVYADLGAMQIVLFDNGVQKESYPIISIGREGTAWQTPLGKFDMSYKMENHFSSLGHVWMPYSMHFFGNYFIHGWPYYSSGMPVATGYSGGCIRLNTPDAKNIFNFVDKKTQLIISTSSRKFEERKDFEYSVKESKPDIQSNFLIADLNTGEVVTSQKSKETVPAESFAKIMTGLTSLETLNQYQETVLDQNIVLISDVIYALLLNDNDEAGQVLYEHKNKNQYLLDMNTRAQSLGMYQTKYFDVNGKIETTVSSLDDTFKLMQYVNWYKPFLIKLLSSDKYEKNQLSIDSIHPLKKDQEYVAGFSNIEKREMITVQNLKGTPLENKTFVIIVTNSNNAEQDTRELIQWLKNSVKIRDN